MVQLIHLHLRYFSMQPVTEWTALNVVEWMSALNLYRYADVFKSKDIKGSDLYHLDREKLVVSVRCCPVAQKIVLLLTRDYFQQNMGIKDEFHQKNILVCIEELCHPVSSQNSALSVNAQQTPTGPTTQGVVGPSSSPPSATISQNGARHSLVPRSFSVLEKCGKCNKYLRGFLHQGFLCQGKNVI